MRTAAKILVPALATLLALALAEGGLRWLAPVPPPAETTMVFTADPHTGYRLQAGASGRFRPAIPAAANRHGHRDDEVDLAKPAGTFRVLVLGDSFTVGASVEQDEAYPQVLERLLRARAGQPVEVVDTGVGGWGPYQYRQHYVHSGRRFDPDLVVIGFFVGNDPYDPRQELGDLPTAIDGRRVRPGARPGLWNRLRVRWIGRSHLARLALASGVSREGPGRDDCRDFTPSYLDLQRRRMERNHRPPAPRNRQLVEVNLDHLAAIAELARTDGAATLVVLIPDENQINPALLTALVERGGALPAEIDLELPQRLLRADLAERGVPVLDLLDDFRRDPRCLYLNDSHWNADGHRLAAERLASHPMLSAAARGGPYAAADRLGSVSASEALGVRESRCQSAIRPMSHMNGSTWPFNTHAPLQML